jgi:hypothetical protein
MIPNHHERKEAADKARQAMLEKFKAKAQDTPQIDPSIVAKREQLAAEREAKRAAAEEKRKARIATEKTQRAAEAKAKAEAEAEALKLRLIAEAQRKRAEKEAAEIRAFEEQARRDLVSAAKRLRK